MILHSRKKCYKWFMAAFALGKQEVEEEGEEYLDVFVKFV